MSKDGLGRVIRATDQISLRDLLTIVFKRRLLIVVVVFTVVATVMVATLRQPRTFRVTSTLLVHEARATMPMAPTDSTQLVMNRVNEQDLNTEIEVLGSRKLVEGVVKELLSEQPSDSGEPAGETGGSAPVDSDSTEDKTPSEINPLVSGILANLEISAIRNSNVLQVGYSSADPEWATRVVAALIDGYLKQRAERYQSPQAVTFFEEQMKEAERRLTELENALKEYVEGASITMVDGPQGTDSLAPQKNLVMSRLGALEASLGDAEALQQQQMRRVVSLRELLAKEPERLMSASRGNRDAALEEVERRLATLKLERDALLQDFKPSSRYVRDIETQIQLAEERLSQARENRMGVDGTESNPVYVNLKGDLLRAEAELEGTRALVTSLRSQVAEYKGVLDKLNEQAFTIARLNRETTSAREDYLLYRKKHEEARISVAMDQERFINVTVAQPAQMPLSPEPRNLLLKIYVSLFVGLLGGVGLAFGLETYVVRSFSNPVDIERRLGIPHLASIPDSARMV